MMKKIIVLIIVAVAIYGGWDIYQKNKNVPPVPVENEIPADIQAHIDSKSDLIRVESPAPMSTITSPLIVRGMARGNWFFEASFPVTLVNWDGLIIAEGYATFTPDPNDPESTWMTTEFIPFEGTLTFENPSFPNTETKHFSKRGAIIFQKDNPSGLPEHDDALEIPVWFE